MQMDSTAPSNFFRSGGLIGILADQHAGITAFDPTFVASLDFDPAGFAAKRTGAAVFRPHLHRQGGAVADGLLRPHRSPATRRMHRLQANEPSSSRFAAHEDWFWCTPLENSEAKFLLTRYSEVYTSRLNA